MPLYLRSRVRLSLLHRLVREERDCLYPTLAYAAAIDLLRDSLRAVEAIEPSFFYLLVQDCLQQVDVARPAFPAIL